MPLPGRHNMENALAAAAIGRIAGLSDEAINAAIRTFKGAEHRLELAAESAAVRWFNDSKATNPDATRVALNAFPRPPVVLIAGGYGGALVMVTSASVAFAYTQHQSAFYYVERQAAWMFIGFVALFVLSGIDYLRLLPLAPAGAVVAALLMILVLVPHLAVPGNGGR